MSTHHRHHILGDLPPHHHNPNARFFSVGSSGGNSSNFTVSFTDRLRFPIFMSLMQGALFTQERLKPELIEGLAEESTLIFQRCCRDESTVSNDDLFTDEQLIGFFVTIDDKLEEASLNKDGLATAKLHHYRKCIATPQNLELLLQLVIIRQNIGRCYSYGLLQKLAKYVFAHPRLDKRMSDGNRFSSNLIRVCSEYVQKAENRTNICDCENKSCELVVTALKFTKDQPQDSLELIHKVSWTDILNYSYIKCDCCSMPLEIKLYLELVKTPCKIMLSNIPESDKTKAKDVLRSIGSAHHLFRNTVGRIVSKEFSWLEDASVIENSEERKSIEASNVYRITGFLHSFIAIAPTMDDDGAMKKLVKRATKTLTKRRPHVARWAATDPSTLALYDGITVYFDQLWPMTANQLQESRWESCSHLLDELLFLSENERKRVKRNYRELDDIQLCAQCFKTETDFGAKMSKCSRCSLFAYCSKNCQTQHWKGGHKSKCQPKD